MQVGQLSRVDFADEVAELPDWVVLGCLGVALGPRDGKRLERPEGWSFFAAASWRCFCANRWALRFEAKAFRWRTPEASRQSANHFPHLVFIGHLVDTRVWIAASGAAAGQVPPSSFYCCLYLSRA